ncbi:ABC transporter permease [Pseudonocardia hydrocarbonoxydans]|uniref:ABC transporter permease n=1 Tax=Pseudonocardia hydrocarbonoxydans TaxID=76726 RepID=UPI0031E31F2F
MGLAGMWVGLELRRRWRSLLVLALLVAVSAGVVLTAVAGARRGASALDRLLAVTAPATLAVLPNQPGFDWDAVRALPGVEAVAEFAVTSFRVDDITPEDYPDGFPMDREAMSAVERPVVLEGRLPDPDRADEVAVTPAFTRSYGVGVGDTVDLRLYAPEQFAAPAPPDVPGGPLVRATVVGTIRSFWFVDQPGALGTVQPSAGLLERYPAQLGLPGFTNVNALVRLTADDPASIAAFRSGLAQVSGRTDIEMFDQVEEAAKARATLGFEAASLLAFAGAALLAATVLVGQAIARHTDAAVAGLDVLRGLGLERAAALRTAVAAPVLAAGVGVLAGAAAAAAASPLFPLGTAALLEPRPGFAPDPLVLGVGSAVLAALCLAGAVAAAAAALRPGAGGNARPSAVAALAARAGLPVPVLVGLRFALEPGRGRSALPVRPALVGAVGGVLGVLGALTFSAGVADAAAHPERFGQTHRLESFVGFNGEDYLPTGPALTAAIAADPDVLAVVDAPVGVLDTARGAVSTFAYGSTGREPFPTVVLSGRMPQAPDEIALAPRTAAEQDAAVGDTLAVTGTAGSATLRVTGIAFVPYAGHNNYDDGAWLTADGYTALIAGFKFHPLFVALRPGADPEVVAGRLAADVGAALGVGEFPIMVTPPPVEATVIRNVQVLPVALGGFLALLAVGAVGHALATAVRRRRHDVAVLRAFGMTRRQVRTVVVTQATVLAAVGLLLGVPLGVAVGRVVWRLVADITPLQYLAPVAVPALLLAAPVAVLVANALAAPPGRRAARLRIAHVLRAE